MRPIEIEREIERLTVDAATARERLSGMRGRLSEVRAMLSEVRRAVSAPTSGSPTEAHPTSRAGTTQGEAETG